MIDLHTHYIPDWDDGARTMEDSLKMCEKARADGIREVVLTPHLHRATLHGDDLQLLDERCAEFLEKAQSTGLRFHRGAEVFAVHNIVDIAREHPAVRLGGSSYVLVEFAENSIPPQVRDMIYQMQLAGFTPIIAHPERNTAFQQRPRRLFELVRLGALAQVTAQSITGAFGPQAKDAVTQFLEQRWVHLIASDTHSLNRREPVLSKGLRAASTIIDEDVARMMVEDVPRAILQDEAVPDLGEPIEPKPARRLGIPIPSFLKKRGQRGEADGEA
ncbi:MAG: CpsB/CapC family capsule biosynthesis tyrosine phosphatase [Acidobacteriota bacterium]